MQLLHEAASRCVELIRDGSGAGIVSFDHDAYPGQPLRPFDAGDTHRADVLIDRNGLSAGRRDVDRRRRRARRARR